MIKMQVHVFSEAAKISLSFLVLFSRSIYYNFSRFPWEMKIQFILKFPVNIWLIAMTCLLFFLLNYNSI